MTKKGNNANKGGVKTGAGKSGAAKAANGSLPRIVIKVDLTKVGNDGKTQGAAKKKAAGDKKKKQPGAKVVLH